MSEGEGPGLGGSGIAIIALLAALPFLTSLGFPFLLDDAPAIRDYPPAHRPDRIPDLLLSGRPGEARPVLYSPLPDATLPLLFAPGGGSPWPFHAANLLLHVAASCLLGAVAVRLLGSRAAGMAAGALFAVLPVHVEAVSWISGRNDLFLAAAGAAAWWFHLKGREGSRGGSVASILLVAAAAASDYKAIGLPFLFAAGDALTARAGVPGRSTRRKYGPLLFAGYGIGLLLFMILGDLGSLRFGTALPGAGTVESAPGSGPGFPGATLGFLLLGGHRCPGPVPGLPFTGIAHHLALLILLGALLTLVIGLRLLPPFDRSPAARGLLLAAAAAFLLLLPAAGMPGNALHTLPGSAFYFASFGVALALAVPLGSMRRGAALAAGILLVAGLGALTATRSQAFGDPILLLKQVTAACPAAAGPHRLLAGELVARGRDEEAAEEIRRTLEESPDDPGAGADLALILARQGFHDEALARAHGVLERGAPRAATAITLAMVMEIAGSPDEGERILHDRIRAGEEDPSLVLARAGLLERQARLPSAAREYERFRERVPGHPAGDAGIGRLHLRIGRFEEAEEALRRAINLDPFDPESLLRLSLVLLNGTAGSRTAAGEALELLHRHQRVASDRAQGWLVIGHAHDRLGDLDAAEEAYRRAIELAPGEETYREALDVFLKARERGSTDPSAEPGKGSDPIPDRLRSLGYVAWDPGADPDLRSVTSLDRQRASPGYFLLPESEGEIHLLGLEGRSVHTWRMPEGKEGCNHAELLPGGDLAVVCHRASLTLLDWNSSVLWDLPIPAHHDLAVMADGTFLAIYAKRQPYWDTKILFDGLSIISPAGERTGFWSSFDNLDHLLRLHAPVNPITSLRERVKLTLRPDYYHMNAVELLPDTELGRRDRRFRAGNLMICLRNANLIAILDQDDFSVVWHWGPGVLDLPHTPTLLDGGSLLVFDNGTHRGFSRVLEVDLPAGEIVWKYRGDPPRSFFSRIQGSAQRLENGNTLICDSMRGRAIEVTPDREIVWEFWNPEFDGGSRARIYRCTRYPSAMVESLLEEPEGS